MKIAMIGHKRIPGREGGVEVVVEELTTRMAKDNDVVVYNRISKRFPKQKEYKGVKIINIPTIEKKSTDAVIYSFLATLHALFGKYDVIHYHALGPSFFLFIPHFFRIKTVVTVHGLNYKTPKWKGFGAKFIHCGEIITAKYADEIIVLSVEQKNYFKEKYNRDTVYIPNGTEIKPILEPNLIKEEWNLEKDSYILFLSRIVPGKGLEHLLKAYNQLNTNIPLVIAGESNFVSDFYKEISELIGANKNIIQTGFVSGEMLSELYSNAKVFVFPSEAEGMPMCLLEALSYNTKCIVSDIPENTEVAKDYAVSFKTADVGDLKEKLVELLDDSIQVKDNSRKYIEENYSWDNAMKKTLDLYTKILS